MANNSMQELNETFTRVTSMLESSVASEQEAAAKQGNQQQGGSAGKMPPTSHTLLDLVITMSTYLSRSNFASLFQLASVILNGQVSDQQLIKKAYKLIPRLATTETGKAALIERNAELQALIVSTADKTPSSARRDRFLAIYELVTYLPTSDLHFIPSILSEVVLGCKESNEKARTAAFELLIHLAKRTIDTERNPEGTKIRNSLVPHMADDAPDAPATLEEFFTMISAGLAGSSPHMVAASVTALSRLFFDFHTRLHPALRSDLVQTVELFLTSNNREIVRSVLGFVKVAVVVLPDDALRPRINTLVPSLMVWSKEHKGRLRSKVKGILDRLIRRFGAPLIEQLVGENDRKLVVNIRKQRERSRRKKKESEQGENEGDSDDDAHGRDNTTTAKNVEGGGKSFSDTFDNTIYGSDLSDESDIDDDASEIDIDEEGTAHTKSSKNKKSTNANTNTNKKQTKQGEQYIRELSPEDNPLDLLAPEALANISTTKPSIRFLNTGPGSKKKQRPAKFGPDGRLLITEDNDDDVQMGDGAGAGGEGGGEEGGGVNAYLAAVSGPDAARRGQKGKLKFSQSQQRKNKDGDGGDGMDIDGDDDDDDGDGDGKGKGKGNKDGKGNANKSGRRGLGVSKTHGASQVQKRRDNNKSRAARQHGKGRSFKVGKR